MLEIAHNTPSLSQRAAESRGGFLWWYVDLRDHSGNGAVLVWSLGLPFLPGSRERQTPEARPAMAISLYEAGRPSGYLLQQYQSGEATLDATTGSGMIGSSRYEISRAGPDIVLTATLDEPMPSSRDRLFGTVTVRGPHISLPQPRACAVHAWGPKTLHAQGSVDLSFGERRTQIEGNGYFDSNVSIVPLQDQKIQSWRWGRISFPSYSVAYYEVLEEDGSIRRHLLRQSSAGTFTELAGRLTFSNWSRGTYGLVAPRDGRIELPDEAIRFTATSVVDDSPFYQRLLTTAVDEVGNPGVGVSEVVIPDKIDEPWQRPFVRMRTHRVGGDNSPWLPLFTGPVPGRAARLLRSLSGHGVSP